MCRRNEHDSVPGILSSQPLSQHSIALRRTATDIYSHGADVIIVPSFEDSLDESNGFSKQFDSQNHGDR